MHPLTTNISAPTQNVHCFGFESAGVLEIDNEYSGREGYIHKRCLHQCLFARTVEGKVRF